jgi:hypothetical protein
LKNKLEGLAKRLGNKDFEAKDGCLDGNAGLK